MMVINLNDLKSMYVIKLYKCHYVSVEILSGRRKLHSLMAVVRTHITYNVRIPVWIQRKGHCTSQAITEIAENLRQAVDNNMYSCGVFLDFSKAFDTVNHKILLSKLESYGIRGLPLELFTSYLYLLIANNTLHQETLKIYLIVQRPSRLG